VFGNRSDPVGRRPVVHSGHPARLVGQQQPDQILFDFASSKRTLLPSIQGSGAPIFGPEPASRAQNAGLVAFRPASVALPSSPCRPTGYGARD